MPTDSPEAPVANVAWMEFFGDRSYETAPGMDKYYPQRDHLSPEQITELMSCFLTRGEFTSFEFHGIQRLFTTSDAVSLFSPSHTRSWSAGFSFSNILPGGMALSRHAVDAGLRMIYQNGIATPDTLIVGTHESMYEKAKILQQEYFDVFKYKLDICVVPFLKDEHRYRWFLASRKNSGLHFKQCGHGYVELCAIRWDWILASLSQTQPTL